MQRVRIGLTGLAFVFLAVLLAAVFTGQPPGEAPITANLIELQKAGKAAPQPTGPAGPAAPAEPLAILGVAPGSADSNRSAPQPAPAAPR